MTSGLSGNKVRILVISLFLMFMVSSVSSITSSEADTDGDGLPDDIELMIGTDPEDPQDPGLYVIYREEYRTLKYNAWETYSNVDDEITIAIERVVVRRGTSLHIEGYTPAEHTIQPSKQDMTVPQVTTTASGWRLDFPEDNSVGKYEFIIQEGEWEKSMEIFVVFDPWETNIPQDKLKGYAYNEDGTRDEYDYIIPTGNIPYKGMLHPFGDDGRGHIDMYEFALAAAGNATDTQEAAARIVRVVAQRNIAVPSGFPQQPIIRDASQILFGNGTTVIHTDEYQYDEYDYIGLTLEDAEILSQNGRSIPEIENYDQAEFSKLINGWCDEVSWATTALLRSVGIPSRVVSVHPSEDTDLMGHFMVEAWFETSLYRTSWGENEGGWYVLDADEWNAHWWVSHPEFWMPVGETFSSRSNFKLVGEALSFGRFQSQYAYIFGPEDTESPEIIDVTTHYLEDDFMLEYGDLTKVIGRGGGDLYKVILDEPARLTIVSDPHANAGIYWSSEDYPVIPIFLEGYPFSSAPDTYKGEEVILMPGTHYIGIYAPQNGNQRVEGNYGYYTLTLEMAEDVVLEEEQDESGFRYTGHVIGIVLVGIWILSYAGKKYI